MSKKFIIAFCLVTFCFLVTTRCEESRTIYTVWDEFVKVSNHGADHATEVQTYFQVCLKNKVSPEEFYNVRAVENLEKAAAEFRQSADKLDELRRRIEHPIPRGTVTAKK